MASPSIVLWIIMAIPKLIRADFEVLCWSAPAASVSPSALVWVCMMSLDSISIAD